MSGYGRRRYKVEGGKLLKRWDGDNEGWHESKADAWEAVAPKPAPEEKKRRGRPPKVKPPLVEPHVFQPPEPPPPPEAREEDDSE